MIKSIFYTRFLLGRGTCVLHQVPEGSIVPEPGTGGNSATHGFSASNSSNNASNSTLFDFTTISDYVIPRQEFCDRLVTICVNRYRVLGYPVCIKDRRYERNEFIFSIALVLEEDADKSSYVGVVRKLGLLFRNLEEQAGFLSREEDRMKDKEKERDKKGDAHSKSEEHAVGKGYSSGISGREKVYALCEMILEDLNNYCECMIPIDPSNTLNLKLFPARRPPPSIYAWHVPLSIVRLSSLARAESSSSWDPTLLRIIPFIDGVASVARISQFADVDLNLTRKAVAHLIYYGCVILLDIFQFGAVYAPTADFGAFVESTEMQAECLRYVMVPWAQTKVSKSDGLGDDDNARGNRTGGITSPHVGIDSDTYGDDDHDKDVTLGSSYRSTTTITSLTQSTAKAISANPTAASSASASASTPVSASAIPSTERMQYLLIRLYASLKQGLTLRNWCIENSSSLDVIDIRRFITFGVIKGILYRVQKYAIASGSVPANSSQPGGKRAGNRAAVAAAAAATTITTRKGSMGGALPTSSTKANNFSPQNNNINININIKSRNSIDSPSPSPSRRPSSSDPPNETSTYSKNPNNNTVTNKTHTNSKRDPVPLPLPLARYLDGTHCFDQICTELEMAERDVLAKIKGWDGDVQLIYR